MNDYRKYKLGDMLLLYRLDEKKRMSLMMIPEGMEDRLLDKPFSPEPLVQLHARGDHLPGFFGNGHTLALSSATDALSFVSQRQAGGMVETVLADASGRTVKHKAMWENGLEAVVFSTVFENNGKTPVTLDLLSSVNLTGITPFMPGDAAEKMYLHRVRSMWSAEGRVQTESMEEAMLEPSWSHHGLRLCKFGQIGSMPVRGYFPFAALEDKGSGVTWAMQLACPSSWQMEIRRRDDCLAMMASLADGDFGHWAKTIQPGERFETPPAYVTVGRGDLDSVSQRLLTVHRRNMPRPNMDLPVLFNEYCTTWGNPSHENLRKIAACLDGRGVDYLVIDAGWYGRDDSPWYACGGDWVPDEKRMFPDGLKATADMIKSHGMMPGLWFELEDCAPESELFQREELLLRRDGAVIDTDNRRFLDMRKEETHRYLADRVLGLLKKCGFSYIKVDYNDCIGVGCDGAESLGEGLRQNMRGTQRFFRRMREEMPELLIENCSSGGHRLEPSMMALSDMASFSDAHECAEIPIIAANLHRVILPAQSQIWAVLRSGDSMRRLNYSLVNTFLGVLCLSGDIFDLTPAQWAKVEEGLAFYRQARRVIRDGTSAFYGNLSASWRHPTGWQAVVRTAGRETLAVIHTFGGGFPEEIALTVSGERIKKIMCSENNPVSLQNGRLTVGLRAPFEAVAVLLD